MKLRGHFLLVGAFLLLLATHASAHTRFYPLQIGNRWQYNVLDETLIYEERVVGTLTKRPLTQADVRTVAEYLWFIRNYEMLGAKVLSSRPGISPGALSWEIIETVVSGGDWGMRDNIAVFSSVYSVDPASGDISYHQSIIKTLQGHQN